jgi:hypothetical protein
VPHIPLLGVWQWVVSFANQKIDRLIKKNLADQRKLVDQRGLFSQKLTLVGHLQHPPPAIWSRHEAGIGIGMDVA